MRNKRKGLVALLVAGVVVVAAAVTGLTWPKGNGQVPPQPREQAQATPDDLERAATKRVFFGHQSVGRNIMSGVEEVYASDGMEGPGVLELSAGSPSPTLPDGGAIVHGFVGENRYPERKLEDFDQRLRSGLGDQVDVAILKFCYLDVTSATDPVGLFEQYKDTMARLERDYPNVTFIYTTVPLRTEPTDAKQWVKEMIGRPNDNAARERYNKLVRDEFGGSGRLFDIAAMQSTEPNGTRVTRNHNGSVHFALSDSYASDPGHLNAAGSAEAASEFLAVIARAGS